MQKSIYIYDTILELYPVQGDEQCYGIDIFNNGFTLSGDSHWTIEYLLEYGYLIIKDIKTANDNGYLIRYSNQNENSIDVLKEDAKNIMEYIFSHDNLGEYGVYG